jgi:alkylation response protein AidB-like acyl-CoA dehydrogenase
MLESFEHQMLGAAVRTFCEKELPLDSIRARVEDQGFWDKAVWSRMNSELGLQGIAVAESFGGSGYGQPELNVVSMELGRALASAPFFSSTLLATTMITNSADAAAMGKYLPGLASGEVIGSLAVSERSGGWDEPVVQCLARQRSTHWTLTGYKRFVLEAQAAHLLLVAARTERGISLFAVEAGAEGTAVIVRPGFDPSRAFCDVSLDNAPATMVGAENEAWPAIQFTLDLARVNLACEMIGAAERLLDGCVSYAKERIQFGRSIGSFQSLKHMLADLYVELEFARSAVLEASSAAGGGDAPLPLTILAAMAKISAADCMLNAAQTTVQIHGGLGFTWDHYAHLYLRRATANQQFLGSRGVLRKAVALNIGL